MINKKAVLVTRPEGDLSEANSKIMEEELAELPDGHVRLQVEHLSIDAFIRTTLDARDGCLLYTSPSPRDRQKSRMPSSA